MDVVFTFRNMESSEAVKSYATEKIAKLQKYLRAPLHAEVVAAVERHEHRIEIILTADGNQYVGNEVSEDMYASINLCMDKIDRQVRDRKGAKTTKRRHPSTGTLAKAGSARASKR